jgi:small-conductance mechanosensitive channel
MNLTINLGDFINQLLQQNRITSNTAIGESIAAVLLFIVAIIAGWIVYHLFEHYFSKLAKKTKTNIDDEIIKNVKRPVYFLVVLIGFWYAVDQLTFLDVYTVYTGYIFLAAEILLIAFIITRIINVLASWYAERIVKQGKKPLSNNILLIFKKFVHVFVYIFAFIAILYVSKIDLSGAVVGMGVAGIAIAFALQSILGDAFSAFSIYFDRPFEIGDFITVGQYSGTVTHISMKSTRLQLLQGEELIISNRELTSGSIRNYKKMEKRRIELVIGINYKTPTEKMKKIPDLLKKALVQSTLVEVVGVYFKEFGSFSLNYLVIYYVNTGDYMRYMGIQDGINYAIKEGFEKEGIEIAYPTQTVILNNKNI